MRFTSLLILLNIILLLSCSDSTDTKSNRHATQSILSPPLDITFQELLNLGFVKNDSMGYFSKVVDDVRISYHFLNDNLPIFTRTILLLNTDSLKAINWVNSHGGIVYSPLIHEESGIIRFLILDRHSSLILTGTLTNNNFSIDFNYPDINNSIRSNNRTIDDDGNFLIEGKDNFGNKTSLSY